MHEQKPEGIGTSSRLRDELRKVVLVLGIFIAIPCAAFVIPKSWKPWLPRNAVLEESEMRKSLAAHTVNAWLEEQRKGKSGNSYWADYFLKWADSLKNIKEGGRPWEPPRFYAVRSWEIVDNDSHSVTVRLESSTKGGQPIITLWEVWLDENAQILHLDEKIRD